MLEIAANLSHGAGQERRREPIDKIGDEPGPQNFLRAIGRQQTFNDAECQRQNKETDQDRPKAGFTHGLSLPISGYSRISSLPKSIIASSEIVNICSTLLELFSVSENRFQNANTSHVQWRNRNEECVAV